MRKKNTKNWSFKRPSRMSLKSEWRGGVTTTTHPPHTPHHTQPPTFPKKIVSRKNIFWENLFLFLKIFGQLSTADVRRMVVSRANEVRELSTACPRSRSRCVHDMYTIRHVTQRGQPRDVPPFLGGNTPPSANLGT